MSTAVRLVLALALAVTLSPRLESHRLDEYLQATRISVTRGRVEIELTLTPGIAVAAPVFAAIDRDRDARVSPQEIHEYGGRVLQDLSLAIDGRPQPLTLVRADAPSWDEMRDGGGAIRVRAVADQRPMARGRHTIRYQNAHDRAKGVYLVNAMKPATADIEILGQRRDRLQHGIDLDVDVTPPAQAAAWLTLVTALFAGGLAARLRGTRPIVGRAQPAVSPTGPSTMRPSKR